MPVGNQASYFSSNQDVMFHICQLMCAQKASRCVILRTSWSSPAGWEGYENNTGVAALV